MSLWLSNIPILLQSLRKNDWYITAFPFAFNGHDYVVVFEDLKELNEQVEYFSVSLTFIDLNDTTRQFKTFANALKLDGNQNQILDFFCIQNIKEPSAISSIYLIYNALNKCIPSTFHEPVAEYKDIILDKIETRTKHEGTCCYDIRHNGKTQNGIQKERTTINTSKTKLLRPSLFEIFGKDKTISFFYRKANALSDKEILKMVAVRNNRYTVPGGK